VAVPDGTPADVAATGRIIDIILAMNAAMESSSSAAVTEALASAALVDHQGQPRAACLFIDANLLAVHRAAKKIGLPTLVCHRLGNSVRKHKYRCIHFCV